MGKPKGKYIHPDKNKTPKKKHVDLHINKEDYAKTMRSFVAGKR